jgi:hypothetical protein
MANPVLDFVMSLVRDPEAAARYAENPSQAIQDANLTDVTSADVNSLIPVVSESLSMGAPVAGADVGDVSNVWASGAATSAFDAFSEHVPDQTIDDAHHLVDDVIAGPVDEAAEDHDIGMQTVDAGGFADSALPEEFHIDDSAPPHEDLEAAAHQLTDDHDLNTDAPGFDTFE